MLVIPGWWNAITKAGTSGWGMIVPFFNPYLVCTIAKQPGWWFILLLIPLVNIVIHLIVSLDIAKHVKKGSGFTVGLWLLGPICFLILGFGSTPYDDSPATA